MVDELLHELPEEATWAQISAYINAPGPLESDLLFEVPPRIELLDPLEFGEAVHEGLKGLVMGYVMQVRRQGKPVYTKGWGKAQAPDDGNVDWTEDTQMHVASVSKLLTAIGLAGLLRKKNISYDARMADYLPTYWKKGPFVDQITFRNLLTHTSGFRGDHKSSFGLMKGAVAVGVEPDDIGTEYYQNMNFALCRVLIPVIESLLEPEASFYTDSAKNNQAWDALSTLLYKSHMHNRVFASAGVEEASCGPSTSLPTAFAYRFPDGGAKGYNSGDWTKLVGGIGWRLTISDLLDVMNQFRRGNSIVSSSEAASMLDAGFGVDSSQTENTPVGKIYVKQGYVSYEQANYATEQCVAFFLPNQVEAAVFVNSDVGHPREHLVTIVKDAFKNCVWQSLSSHVLDVGSISPATVSPRPIPRPEPELVTTLQRQIYAMQRVVESAGKELAATQSLLKRMKPDAT